jgi:hypothetical protein
VVLYIWREGLADESGQRSIPGGWAAESIDEKPMEAV